MKYIVLIFTVCCLVAGCATSRPIPATRSLTASLEEQMLWRRAQEEQDSINDSGVLYQDAAIETYLNQIAAKLQKNSRSTDISFQIKVVKDPNLNAFAFPNGVIYIHSGILARMDNEAQVSENPPLHSRLLPLFPMVASGLSASTRPSRATSLS